MKGSLADPKAGAELFQGLQQADSVAFLRVTVAREVATPVVDIRLKVDRAKVVDQLMSLPIQSLLDALERLRDNGLLSALRIELPLMPIERTARFDAAMLAIIADHVPSGIGSALGKNAGGNSLDNTLRIRRSDGPDQTRHAGAGYLSESARAVTRLPGGHPEGYLEAFAVLYREFADALEAWRSDRSDTLPDTLPGIRAGVRGMRFIERAIESSKTGKWVDF